MQNIAKFRIIGRVGTITEHDKVTKVNVVDNYNRQENGEWVTDTHWNEVTLFGKLIERATKAQKGDLVYITGRIRGPALHGGADRRLRSNTGLGRSQAAVPLRGTCAMRL